MYLSDRLHRRHHNVILSFYNNRYHRHSGCGQSALVATQSSCTTGQSALVATQSSCTTGQSALVITQWSCTSLCRSMGNRHSDGLSSSEKENLKRTTKFSGDELGNW